MASVGVWIRRLFGGRGAAAEKRRRREQRGTQAQVVRPVSIGAEWHDDPANDFAVRMYDQLRQRPGNLFFSPFSLRTALAMAQAGAEGETARQMREVLRLSSSGETRHAALAELLRQLTVGAGRSYEMIVANSLWGREGAPLRPEFLDLVTRYYRGRVRFVDFRRHAEAARATINRWVGDNTRQRIPDLIPPGGLSVDARLVLVNAVYFKGTWVQQFERAGTRAEPFHLEDGATLPVALMHQHAYVWYLREPGFQVVDLIYEGGDLSMLVVLPDRLPDRQDGLRELETRLSARMIHGWVAQMREREVTLLLPRFKVASPSLDVRAELSSLGMPQAFDRLQADFSGITGHASAHQDAMYLSAVYHKAFVDVHEQGAEAAAATALHLPDTDDSESGPSAPVPVFRADHPFLFAIRHRQTGTILFLGRMVEPTQNS